MGDGRGYAIEPVDAEGFVACRFDPPRFNSGFGPLLARVEGERLVRVRVETGPHTANMHDGLHGGFALAAIDQALPVALAVVRERPVGGMVTLALSSQFVAAGRVDRPIDILVTLVRESGRLFFLHGTVEQEDTVLLTWQATMSKVGAPA